MRHRKKVDKLSRSRAQRKALIRSLVRSLFIYERIKTTSRKAKSASLYAERLITLGKRGDLHSRRLVYSFLQDHKLVKKVCDDIAQRFKDVNGGYTRIVKLGKRKGDGAPLSILELTQLKIKEKPKKKEGKKEEIKKEPHRVSLKEAPKKTEPKKGLRESIRKIFKKERDSL